MIFMFDSQGTGDLIPVNQFRTDWIFVATIIPIILFIVSSIIERGSLSNLTKIIYNPRYANTAFRSAGAGKQYNSVNDAIITLASITTFAYFCQAEYGFFPFSLHGLLLWGATFAIILTAVSVRYFISVLTGEITGNRELFREYMFNIISFYKFLGLILVPVNFFIAYLTIVPQRVMINLVLAIIALLLIFRLLRLVSIFIRGNFSLFYLILYLCALEFTPILIFVKYISGTV